MIISAWWLRTSSKFSGKKLKKQLENSEMNNSKAGADSSKNITPPSLSRDRRIKIDQNKQTNKQTKYIAQMKCNK